MSDPRSPTVVFETLHGSRAYGLAREGSDTDLKGVVVGPRAWYFGFEAAPEQIELGPDHVRYEVRKLLRLAAASNPSILEILFADEADHRVVTPAGEKLLAARPKMLSQRVADTFGGYALSQLARIRRHRRWLLEPPEHEPTRADFGLPERAVIPRDQLGAAEALQARGALSDDELSPRFLAILDRERRYRAARKEWTQYRHWQTHRSPARAALEAAHGYDTKHAMHLVRLSRMAVEILATGRVRVRRDHDRDELLAVRDGAWTYDELMAEVDALKAAIRDAKAKSTLPEVPDEEALNAASVAIVGEVLGC
ncbi:MAG TPA: nucleotidyltransferase domain-containing protein [Sandaracinaceae bacterium LLY-WYZ-13_1]|nr:nucleotidyltransferase domain-containing protein [Sandaracinaceae bacterium LLY-WYZ-13_1]